MRQEKVDETLETESEQSCPFCAIESNMSSVLFDSKHFYLTEDKFPVSPGHLLIIPKRHITSPSDLSETEWRDLRVVLEEACSLLKVGDKQITGFNLGINIGSDAGQTIPHLHVHVIPRRHASLGRRSSVAGRLQSSWRVFVPYRMFSMRSEGPEGTKYLLITWLTYVLRDLRR